MLQKYKYMNFIHWNIFPIILRLYLFIRWNISNNTLRYDGFNYINIFLYCNVKKRAIIYFSTNISSEDLFDLFVCLYILRDFVLKMLQALAPKYTVISERSWGGTLVFLKMNRMNIINPVAMKISFNCFTSLDTYVHIVLTWREPN